MNRYGRLTVAVAAGLGLAGCDTTGPGDGNAALSISFARAPASGGFPLAAARVPVTDGTHTLDVQALSVTFDEVVLELDGPGSDVDADSDSDSDSDGAANMRIARGPATVDFPLQGGVITPFEEAVPAGTYEEIELDFATVRLTGTYDGAAFDVTVPLDLEAEYDLSPGLVLPEGEPFNITVTFDALGWFREANGTVIDPRRLPTDAAMRNRFRQRVAQSIAAFEDADRDADDEDSDSDSG